MGKKIYACIQKVSLLFAVGGTRQRRLNRKDGAMHSTGDWPGHPYGCGQPVCWVTHPYKCGRPVCWVTHTHVDIQFAGSPLPMWTSSLLGHPYRCGGLVCWITLTHVDVQFAGPPVPMWISSLLTLTDVDVQFAGAVAAHGLTIVQLPLQVADLLLKLLLLKQHAHRSDGGHTWSGSSGDRGHTWSGSRGSQGQG